MNETFVAQITASNTGENRIQPSAALLRMSQEMFAPRREALSQDLNDEPARPRPARGSFVRMEESAGAFSMLQSIRLAGM